MLMLKENIVRATHIQIKNKQVFICIIVMAVLTDNM